MQTEIVILLTLIASLGLILSSIKMLRTPVPKAGIKRAIQRHF